MRGPEDKATRPARGKTDFPAPARNPRPRGKSGQAAGIPDSTGELPDYELDEPKRRAHHWLLDQIADIRVRIVLGLVALGFISWLAAPPLYREIKSRRALQLMEKSEAAAENGKTDEAVATMRQAVLLSPGNEEVFRRVRALNASLGDTGSLNAIANNMMDGRANPLEILVVAEQSIKSGKKALARTALDKLATHESARKSVVEIKLLGAEGRRNEALALAKKSINGLEAADTDKIKLATAEMMLADDPATSQRMLLAIAARPTPEGLAASRILASHLLAEATPGNPAPSAVADTLAAHPLKSPDDLLLAADLRILQDPSSKRAVIADLKKQRANAPGPEALAFARWLNRRMAHGDTIEFVGRQRAIGHQDWLLVYLDALAAQNQWSDVFNILDAEQVSGLSESIRLLFLARSAAESGETEKAQAAWHEMQAGIAYEKPEVAAFVASYAMRVGERDQALKAYTTMSNRKETALEGYLGLIRCWPSNAPASELLPVYTEFVETFPAITEAQTDLAYLKLLTKTATRRTAAEALETYNKQPSSLAAISVAALGMLRTGDFARADALYNGKVIAWSTAPAPWKNIRAAVLHSLGRNAEAEAMMSGVDRNTLRPEERALLPAETPANEPAGILQ